MCVHVCVCDCECVQLCMCACAFHSEDLGSLVSISLKWLSQIAKLARGFAPHAWSMHPLTSIPNHINGTLPLALRLALFPCQPPPRCSAFICNMCIPVLLTALCNSDCINGNWACRCCSDKHCVYSWPTQSGCNAMPSAPTLKNTANAFLTPCT